MNLQLQGLAALLVAASTVTGCAVAVIQDVPPREATEPLHEASDEGIEVVLDEVIVRNGAGAWVRDADWDEYRVRIKARSAAVEVREVALFDPRGTRVSSWSPRIVTPGVANEIQRRRTPLPASIAPGADKPFTLFFPLTPRPRGVEVVYSGAQGERRFTIDTRATLAKVHVDPPPQLVYRTEPVFPIAALREGVTSGRVRARLTISMNGTVDRVAILDAQPPGLFEWEAAATMTYWRYNEASFGDRTIEEVLEFKR